MLQYAATHLIFEHMKHAIKDLQAQHAATTRCNNTLQRT